MKYFSLLICANDKLSYNWFLGQVGSATKIYVGGMRPAELTLPGTYSSAVAAPLLIALHPLGGDEEKID